MSVGGLGVWRFPPSFVVMMGGEACVRPWGAFVHLSGTSACLWLQHESTFGVLPCGVGGDSVDAAGFLCRRA